MDGVSTDATYTFLPEAKTILENAEHLGRCCTKAAP